jgi:nucleotide-binding universal stress UspA family protein
MNDRTQNERSVADRESERQSNSVGFKKILVAVDYLSLTSEIFQQACEAAKKYDGQLMVCHIVPGNMPGISEIVAATSIGAYGGAYSKNALELQEQLLEEAVQEMQVWLHSFVQNAEKQGITAEFEYRIGVPGKQICDLAKTWGADLIIIGRRGRTGLSELFLGSVSNYVVHQAHCSVLIVQH